MSGPQLPPVTHGMIPAAEVAQFLHASGMTIEQLMLALIPQAQKVAIPPISNFFVGAVALGVSGSIYFGANYEFIGQALSFTPLPRKVLGDAPFPLVATATSGLPVSCHKCAYTRASRALSYSIFSKCGTTQPASTE